MAEELADALDVGAVSLVWGRHLGGAEERRQAYLSALRGLDVNRNDIEPLVKFAIDPPVEDLWTD